jgi:hypothetical protein
VNTSNKPLSLYHEAMRIYQQRRFATLLVIFVLVIVCPPVLLGFGLSPSWSDGMVSIVVLVGILSLCFERQQRAFALLFGISSVLFSTGGYAVWGSVSAWVLFIGHLCQVLFFLGAAVLIVRSMFSSRALSADSIAGAVCGYLFLGLAWATVYSTIEGFRPGSFEFGASLGNSDAPARAQRQVFAYFSFVTLTTVGYGDVVPKSPATRTCAWMEAVTGQFYLAVIVAGLVSMLVAKKDGSEPCKDLDSA